MHCFYFDIFSTSAICKHISAICVIPSHPETKDFKRNSPNVKIQHECDTVTSTATKYISSAVNPKIIDIHILVYMRIKVVYMLNWKQQKALEKLTYN